MSTATATAHVSRPDAAVANSWKWGRSWKWGY
jgi:hypothetical protein